jgi:hypothetical protein
MVEIQASPIANYVPYNENTGRVLEALASYEPRTLATMHGSTYHGDGATQLRGLAAVMRDVLGVEAGRPVSAVGG